MDSELVRWGEKSLQVQDACNGMGVANSLVQLMRYLQDSKQTYGTDDINRHPLVKLFVAKLADLAGLECTYPVSSDAWASDLTGNKEV